MRMPEHTAARAAGDAKPSFSCDAVQFNRSCCPSSGVVLEREPGAVHLVPDPSRRLAPAPARRRSAEGRGGRECGAVCARHRDAQSESAGDYCCPGAGLSRADPRGLAAGQRLRAPDDALPHRPYAGRRDCAGRRQRHRLRGKALSRRCDHQLRCRRDRYRSPASGTRGAAAHRHAAARTRRSDRPGGRCVRPRGRVHRPGARAAATPLSGSAHRLRAPHHAGGRAVCERCGRWNRRNDHRPPSALQPQRDLQRRLAAALVLPAGAQARNAPAGAHRGGDRRQPAFFPWHRQRATSGSPEGPRSGLRRLLHRAPCHRALCNELYATAFERADALDRLEAFASFHGADFYGLPRNEGRIVLRRESWTIPEAMPFGKDEVVPLASGESLQWRLAR